MNIIKRNGTEVVFDNSKIVAAVEKANTEVPEIERLTKEEIEDITNSVEEECSSMSRTLNVEEIQNLVEDEIMKREHFSVARKYITYRYKRALVRKANTTDDQILSLIECANEEVKQENSITSGRCCKGSRRRYNSFSRFRLFCTAYAQLLSCKFRGYAPEWHSYKRNYD